MSYNKKELELTTDGYMTLWHFWDDEDGERYCEEIVRTADYSEINGKRAIIYTTGYAEEPMVKHLFEVIEGQVTIRLGAGTVELETDARMEDIMRCAMSIWTVFYMTKGGE